MESSLQKIVVLLFTIATVLSLQENLKIEQNCSVRVVSKSATAHKCHSDADPPFAFNLTIQLTKTLFWKGSSSWKYALEDSARKLTPLNHYCQTYEADPGTYQAGSDLGMGAKCMSLPRQLKIGDSWWLYLFSESGNPDNWLIVTIPVKPTVLPSSIPFVAQLQQRLSLSTDSLIY